MSMSASLDSTSTARLGDTQRATAVLGLIGAYLGDAAAAVQSAEIGGLLDQLAALVHWAEADAGRSQRAAERGEQLRSLCGSTDSAGAVANLVVAESHGDQSAARRLRELLALQAYVEEGTSGIVHAARTQSGTTAGVSVETTTDYLRRRLASSDVDVESVVQDGSGFSMYTIFVACRIDGDRRNLVLRQVPAGLSAQAHRREYDIIERVWEPELPIAQPLWYENAPGPMGTPFMVFERVGGRTMGTFAGATEHIDARICEQLAGLLGRLHLRDTSDLSAAPIPPMRTHAEITAATTALEELAHACAGPPSPRLAAIFGWLRSHVPSSPKRPSLVHGDVGFHNILIESGSMTALLDWERCHFGDPAEELAYLRPSIEPVFGWDTFMSAYQAAGGAPPEPERELFYTVWQDAWRTVECLQRAANFDKQPTLMTAIAGFVMGSQFLKSALSHAFPDISD